MKKQFRQGEILLTLVDSSPQKEISGKFDNVILGHGESGNAHVLVADDVQWIFNAIDDINDILQGGARVASEPVFIHLPYGGHIEHTDRNPNDRHSVLDIDPGTYLVTIDREQLPWEEEARRVYD